LGVVRQPPGYGAPQVPPITVEPLPEPLVLVSTETGLLAQIGHPG